MHFLATGAAGSESSVGRRQRGGDVEDVPCPAIVSDYHRLYRWCRSTRSAMSPDLFSPELFSPDLPPFSKILQVYFYGIGGPRDSELLRDPCQVRYRYWIEADDSCDVHE